MTPGRAATPRGAVTPRLSPLRVARAWVPAVLYLALIWWLSSQRIDLPLDRVPWRDKGVHFLEYFALGACFAHAVWITWSRRGQLGAVAAWLFTVASGLLDELHQALVPFRSADLLDLAADAAGALLAVVVVWTVRTHLEARAARRAS